MKTLKTFALLSCLLAGSISHTLHSQGLLGERHISLSYVDTSDDLISGQGFGIVYNQHLFDDSQFGYDLNIGAGYAELDDDFGIGDVDGQEIDLGLVIYPLEEMELRPYISAGIGYGEASLLGETDGSFKFNASIGGEWRLSERFLVTPYFQYLDYTDIDDGDQYEFGLNGDVWLNKVMAIGLGYARTSTTSIDGDYDLETISATLRFRF